jgi:hypothetical protein
MLRYRVELFYLYVPCANGEFTQIIRQHEMPCYNIIQDNPKILLILFMSLIFLYCQNDILLMWRNIHFVFWVRILYLRSRFTMYNCCLVTWLPRIVLVNTS